MSFRHRRAAVGCAALVMNLLSPCAAFGLMVAVLIDATIVCALLVPALMRWLGDWNWWVARPLARLLPA